MNKGLEALIDIKDSITNDGEILEYTKQYKTIKQDLERLEKLEKENKKLKEIIKDNFGYNEKTKECFFNYDGPVMEEEIREVINYEEILFN